MTMPLKKLDQEICRRVGFSELHASQLANLMGVLRGIDSDLQQEGKPGLLEIVRQKRISKADPLQPIIRSSHAGYTPLEIFAWLVCGGVWLVVFDRFLSVVFQ